MRKVVHFIFVFVFALFFVACGGGGGGGGTPLDPTTVSLDGIAVDNYISGATVCIDTNKDNICNNGEVTTTTNSSGVFSFPNMTATDDMVIIAYGGRDADTNETFPYIIKNLAKNTDLNKKVVLSSLNTLVTDYKLLTNKSLDDSKVAIANFVASSSSANIIEDIIAKKLTLPTEFLRSLKIFQMVASINDINDSNNSALSFKAIAKAIVNNENIEHNSTFSVTFDDNTSKQIANFVSAPVFMDIPTPTVQNGISFVMNLDFVESPDGGTITYSLSGGDSGLFVKSGNAIYFQTAPFFAGNIGDRTTKAFNLTALVNGKSVEKNISVTVVMATPIPPVATFTSFSTNEDVNFTGTLTATDADTNLSSLSYSKVINPSHGTVVVDSNGSFTYSPIANYNGSDRFDYNISDGINNVTQSVIITINPINDAPIISGTPNILISKDSQYIFTPTVVNVDNDTLIYNITNKPSWAVFNSSTGVLSGRPEDGNESNATDINISVSDGTFTASLPLFNITVTATNNPPTGITLFPLSVNENSDTNITLNTVDNDSNVFVYSLISGAGDDNNSSFTISGNQLIFKTRPNYEAQSTYSIRLKTADDAGADYNTSFTITINNINETPTISTTTYGDYNQSTNFTTPVLVVSDPDSGDTHRFTLLSSPNLTSKTFTDTTGVLSGLAGDEFVGTHTITVRVRDQNGTGLYSDNNISLTINEVNDAPTSGNLTSSVPGTLIDGNLTISPNQTVIVTIPTITDGDIHLTQTVTLTDFDNNNTEDINATVTDSNGTDGTATISFKYIKAGKATVTFKLKDDGSPIEEKSFSLNVIARGSGWDLYKEQKDSNYTIPTITFDEIVYDWNSVDRWYETNETNISNERILLPMKNLTDTTNKGSNVGGSNGHYYVLKNNYMKAGREVEGTEHWKINRTPNYKTYNRADGTTGISAINKYFQHDAAHGLFVSTVIYKDDTYLNDLLWKDGWVSETIVNYVASPTIVKSYGIDINSSNTYATTSQQINQQNDGSVNTDGTGDKCSVLFGEGWRLPTAYEMGINAMDVNDIDDFLGYIPAYVGDDINDNTIISSTKVDNTYHWSLGLQSAVTTGARRDDKNYARCVYYP